MLTKLNKSIYNTVKITDLQLVKETINGLGYNFVG